MLAVQLEPRTSIGKAGSSGRSLVVLFGFDFCWLDGLFALVLFSFAWVLVWFGLMVFERVFVFSKEVFSNWLVGLLSFGSFMSWAWLGLAWLVGSSR